MLILNSMRALRVLTNSLLCGLFFSGLLSLLFADLNINQKITVRFLAGLALHLMIVYGLFVACVFFLAFLILQFLFGRKFQLAAVSPRFLSLGFSSLILLFLIFFRANTAYFSSFFDFRLRRVISAQLWTLLFLAALGFAAYYGFRRAKRKDLFFLPYFLLLGAGLIFVFTLRSRFSFPPPSTKVTPLQEKKTDRKITMIGLEGLSFEMIIPLVSAGRLPNFAWLMDNGSSGRLISFSPNEPVTLNASLSTGKFPAKHRQLSLSQYKVWKVREPMEVVPRFILFTQLSRTGFLSILPSEPASRIMDMWTILQANRIPFIKRDWPYDLAGPLPSSRAQKLLSSIFSDSPHPSDEYFSLARNAFIRDCFYEEEAAAKKNETQPRVYYLLLDGLNAVTTYFYKFSFPQQFGSLDQALQEKYRSVIENYYNFYDELIGKYLTGLKEDELLVVFSPHGLEPLPLWKRFIERILGNTHVSATHEFAPDGAVFFYGKGIMQGKNIEGMRIVDIAPTLLYYLGLPVGRDMDGIIRSPLFLKEFIAENPIITISSYEEFKIFPSE